MKTDTIAAIATAITNSGIGIIRVSGEDAIPIINRIYHSKNDDKKLTDRKSHTIHYGFIMDQDELIDEVMVSVMKSPNSYTTEDTVEINCHGGILVMQRILETVLKSGARIAEPGEFTKRAFLNGRIDLAKAEAVMDVIQAKNELALKSSIKQLKGSVSEKIRKNRAIILHEIAFIESALDDPEHISLDGYPNELEERVNSILEDMEKLLYSSENGKIMKEGINTVIVGKPNAGKSSLLNKLVGEEKAIVTNVAGTTRDVLEESIRLNGISLNMIDTAGIRSTEDIVEKIGVEKAIKYAEDADLVIYVVDSSVPLDENDDQIIEMINNKKYIVIFNKSDLKNIVSEQDLRDILGEDAVIIKTSMKENLGIDIFEEKIEELFFHGKIDFNDQVFITNVRHKEALQDTCNSLVQVKKSLQNHMPEDFYSIDLMSAYQSLGVILGEEIEDDLVNEIFAKFCMGK